MENSFQFNGGEKKETLEQERFVWNPSELSQKCIPLDFLFGRVPLPGSFVKFTGRISSCNSFFAICYSGSASTTAPFRKNFPYASLGTPIRLRAVSRKIFAFSTLSRFISFFFIYLRISAFRIPHYSLSLSLAAFPHSLYAENHTKRGRSSEKADYRITAISG